MNKNVTSDLFNGFIENLPQPVCILKLCDKTLYSWNQQFSDLSGYYGTDLKGKSWTNIFSFPPSDKKPFLRELKEKKSISGLRSNLQNKDGDKLPVMLSITITSVDDEDLILITICDISDFAGQDNVYDKRLLKEQRLRAHFENTPLAIVEWDNEFVVTKWSKKAERIFGWKGKEVLGKPIHNLNLIYPEDVPLVNKTMERLRRENTVTSGNRNVTKDGRVIYCIWYNSVLKDSEGKMVSVLSLVDDISVQKKTEEQLTEYSEKLEQTVSARTSELMETNKILQEEITTRRLAEAALKERTKELENLKNNLEDLVHQRTAELQANNRKLTKEIVDRRRAVEALRESERKYREIVQNIPGMVFQLKVTRDGKNQFSYISPHAGYLFDLPAEEITTDTEFTKYIHPDDREVFLNSLGDAINNQIEWKFEGRILTAGNDVKWFQGVSSPALVGQELVFDGLFLDITEKKLALQKKEESEQYFTSLFTSLEDGFHMSKLIYDKDGNPVDVEFIFANNAFYEQTGIKEEVSGKTLSEIAGFVDPTFLEAYARVISTGIPEHLEQYYPATEKVYSLYTFRTYENYFAVLFHDLTEEREYDVKIREAQEEARESQLYYSRLFDSMTDGVQVIEIIFDESEEKPVDWVYLALNPAWHIQTGIRENYVGKRVKDIIPDVEPWWLETFGRVVKTGIPESFENYNAFTGRYYFTYTYKLKDHQCAVVVQDTTEKRRIQEQLLLSEKRFRSLFESMEESCEILEVIFDDKGDPADLRYITVNRAWYRMTGLPPKVDGRLASEVVPGIEPIWKERYGKVAKTGIPDTIESYNAYTDKFYLVHSFKIDDKLCATLLSDVTKKRREEEEVKVNLTKFQVLFDSFPLGITISDKEGKIIEINEMARKILEIDYSEAEKRTISGKEWNIIDTEGKILPSSEFASVKALRTNSTIANQEMGLVNEKGDVKWLNVTATPIPLDGYGVAITYNDITEKFRSREILEENYSSYQTLFNALTEGFAVHEIICDEKGNPVDYRFLDMNPAFEKLTGMKKKDIIGKTVREVIPQIEKEWIETYGEVAITGNSREIERYSHAMKQYFRVFVYSPAHMQFATLFIDISESKLSAGKKKVKK